MAVPRPTSRRPRPLAVAATAALALGVLVLAPFAAPAGAQQPVEPYRDPPFTCDFHRFGEGEAPDVDAFPDDPLCVEYEKRDITVSNGGAVAFLLAEPARFSLALDKCQYWQVDHWSVQVTPETTPIVRWDGSYWFDKGAGLGAVKAANFEVGGQPADGHAAADAIEPVSPELADAIREYSATGGGGGMTFTLPGGLPSCAAASPSPSPTPYPPEPDDGSNAQVGADEDSLPTTGAGAVLPAAALVVAALGLARRRGRRGVRDDERDPPTS